MAITTPNNYYKCNESSGTTLTDATGGSNGTISASGVTYSQSGVTNLGTSLLFDGVNGNASIPMAYNSVWSLNLWFNPSANTAMALLGNDSGGTSRAILIQTLATNTQIAITVWDSSNATPVSLNPLAYTCTVGSWFMMTLVKSATDFKIYNNGTLVSTTVTAFTYKNTGTSTFLADRNTPALKWNGKIQAVGYWSAYTLTQAEITSLYNSGNGTAYPFLSSGMFSFFYK